MNPRSLPHIGCEPPEGDFTGDEDWLADLNDAGGRLHPFDASRSVD